MNKKKIIGLSGLLLVLCVVIYFVFFQKPEVQIRLEAEKVKLDTICNSVTATGTVEPITQVEVGTQVSGTIDKIYVDYNSEVKKGQLLAELDKTLLASELAAKKTDFQSCKTEYEYQEKNYIRNKVLHEKQLISDSDFETIFYQYEVAKNNYNKSKFDVDKAQTNLNYATIYSPIDGVVLSRSVDEGQTVAASFSTPTLFTIANDLEKMQVVANVDEADIGQVKEKQRVTFTVDAFPDDIFEGEVMQVRLEATTTSSVVTYEVIVNAPNPQLKLKPGLTANITIYTLEKNGILTVPNKALHFDLDTTMLKDNAVVIPLRNLLNDNNSKTVWTKSGNNFVQKKVQSGITNGIKTEIVSGLKEGEVVLIDFVSGMPIMDISRGGETSPFMPQRPGGKKK